jgi:carbon storage regulator CsrA
MLVLTRKYQEKIRIGNNITITVLRTKGKAVRLGIEAPADVPVIRGELSFEHESEPAAEEVSIPAFEVVEAPARRTRATGARAKWATTSHPRSNGCTTAQETELKVSMGRVPRNKVAAILPTLVSGNGPLRAMMEERTSR